MSSSGRGSETGVDGGSFAGSVPGGGTAPNLSTLGEQFRQLDVGTLIENSSSAVIYQHLGVARRDRWRCISASLDEAMRRQVEQWLSPLREIAALCSSGTLWSVGLVRFLRYCRMMDSVRLLRRSEHVYEIDIRELEGDPRTSLQGLTFYREHDGPVQLVEVDEASRGRRL